MLQKCFKKYITKNKTTNEINTNDHYCFFICKYLFIEWSPVTSGNINYHTNTSQILRNESNRNIVNALYGLYIILIFISDSNYVLERKRLI